MVLVGLALDRPADLIAWVSGPRRNGASTRHRAPREPLNAEEVEQLFARRKDGLNFSDIAAELGCHPSTVKTIAKPGRKEALRRRAAREDEKLAGLITDRA